MNTSTNNETTFSTNTPKSEGQYKEVETYQERVETTSTSRVEKGLFVPSDITKRKRMKELNRKTSKIFG